METTPGNVKHLGARVTLRLSRRILELDQSWSFGGDLNSNRDCGGEYGLLRQAFVRCVRQRLEVSDVPSAGDNAFNSATTTSSKLSGPGRTSLTTNLHRDRSALHVHERCKDASDQRGAVSKRIISGEARLRARIGNLELHDVSDFADCVLHSPQRIL
jgi:hypothetical protein